MKLFRSIAVAGTLVLAACQQTQVVDSTAASGFAVVEVQASTEVKRENTAVPKEQIVEVVRRKTLAKLRNTNPAGRRDVTVIVNVRSFYIANAGAGVLLGSTSSGINAEVSLVDASTGAPIGEPFTVSGVTEPRPTVFGALAIKSPEEELEIIADDLAARISIAIYGA